MWESCNSRNAHSSQCENPLKSIHSWGWPLKIKFSAKSCLIVKYVTFLSGCHSIERLAKRPITYPIDFLSILFCLPSEAEFNNIKWIMCYKMTNFYVYYAIDTAGKQYNNLSLFHYKWVLPSTRTCFIPTESIFH